MTNLMSPKLVFLAFLALSSTAFAGGDGGDPQAALNTVKDSSVAPGKGGDGSDPRGGHKGGDGSDPRIR